MEPGRGAAVQVGDAIGIVSAKPGSQCPAKQIVISVRRLWGVNTGGEQTTADELLEQGHRIPLRRHRFTEWWRQFLQNRGVQKETDLPVAELGECLFEEVVGHSLIRTRSRTDRRELI